MPISLAAAILYATLLAGCSSGPSAVSAPEIDSGDAADQAMDLYDADQNGAIDKTELAKSPPLSAAASSYDANGDGQLTAEEIASRLTALTTSGVNLTGMEITVTHAARPLASAVVRLRPDPMLGDSLPSAEGTTDDYGVVRPAISDEHLPADLAGNSLVYPGLYLVEVTHPTTQIPARYNTATELGLEVDPTSRTGASARFDLKAN
jgi:hypothetical protein